MATLYRPPLPNLRLTLDYLPARDGLPLQIGGPNRVTSRAGYIADIAANPTHLWQPRLDQNEYAEFYSGEKGQRDNDLGHYNLWADPEYAWSNGYTGAAINGSGNLVIRAQKVTSVSPAFGVGEVPDSATWVSTLLTTKDAFSQRGGYWEITAKAKTGVSAWPAMWFYPQNESLGQHKPEIDLLESFGGQPGFDAGTYYTNAIDSSFASNSTAVATGADIGLAFHRYGLKHESGTLTYYFDGQVVATKSVAGEFWTAIYLLMGMQIGSTLPGFVPAPDGTTPDPADLEVSSVRCWQFRD